MHFEQRAIAGRLVGALCSGSDGCSTASTSRLMLTQRPCGPSPSTIAHPASQLTADIAMRAMARRRGVDNERTQRRPRQAAWTGAPCHTRTATPPGRPTNPHWMAAPVGRVLEHEDENRDACAAGPAVSVFDVRVGERAHGVTVPGLQSGGAAEVRALRGSALTSSPSAPGLPPTTPSPKSLTPPCHLSHRPPIAAAATKASVNLDGSKTRDAHVAERWAAVCVSAQPVARRNPDTHTVASKLLRPYAAAAYSLLLVVGLEHANGAHRSTGALTNHEGNRILGTSTAAVLHQAAPPPPTFLRASGDWSAGVHDGVTGTTELNSWRTTARAALLAPLVMLLDATWTALKRPGSGSHTPDAVGKDHRRTQGCPGRRANGATQGVAVASAGVDTDGGAGMANGGRE